VALVLVITPILFPSAKKPATTLTDSAIALHGADSARAPVSPPSAATTASTPSTTAASRTTSPIPTVSAAPAPTGSVAPTARPVVAESAVVVATPRAEYVLQNPGAGLASVTLPAYRSLLPGKQDTMRLMPPRGPLLHYRLALGRDTVALDTVAFTVQHSGATTTFTATSPAMTIEYQPADGYRMSVRGSITNAPAGAALVIDLPREFRSVEADTLDDQRHFAYGYKIPFRDVESIQFGKLDSTKIRADTGSMQWVDARDKYWVLALMQPVGAAKPAGVFHGLTMRGGTRVGRITRSAFGTTAMPLSNGQFAFDVYAGPQSWEALHVLGNDLESVNPYAGFLHPVVQPFATIMLRVLLWMKANLKLSYGWVLVVFGVVIRLLLWPLNQKAMRTSIAMQRLQPELTEVQKKYKNEPDKQREALMKIYQSHGMSPLSPMLGCLPMLLPMPILYALYFVFQNTIEFRGVPFLWLSDLSLRDPYYIIPVLMGASMFLLSWIGMRAMPPNPQTAMMSYMMPVLFTVMFLNFASGLNLYYAVQNIAALPQQWMITRERARAGLPAPTLPGMGGGGKKT
jgi:YidC/Oxa1 family membrane protein insertase